MAAATARLEVRMTPEEKSRLEYAAALTSVPVSEFVRSAVEEHLEKVLLKHEARTVVPAEYFDALIASLDEPDVVNPAIVAAGRRHRAWHVE